MRKLVLFSVMVLLFQTSVLGQENKTVFENANTAYNAGQFEQAVMLYKEILESGQHSAALYFNLANAYYRLNQVAESIFYFEKAKQLNPTDEDIIINGAFAQNMAIDAIEVLPKSQITQWEEKAMGLFSQEGWAYFTVFLAWMLALFWALYLKNRIPLLKRSFFVAALTVALLFLGTLSIAVVKFSRNNELNYGILFNKKIEVSAEPNSRSEALFLLHEGTKVELLDQLQEWQKIRIANGSEGWIKEGTIRSLKNN